MNSKNIIFLVFSTIIPLVTYGQENSKVYNALKHKYGHNIKYSEYWNMYQYVNDKNSRTTGVCDLNGREIIKPGKYTNIEKEKDFFIVENNDRNYGVLDLSGNKIVDEKYHTIFIRDDNFICINEENYILMDFQGNILIKRPVEEVARIDIITDGCFLGWFNPFAIGQINEKIVIYSPTGKPILETIFRNIQYPSEELIAFKEENGLWGYMNIWTGVVMIEPQYTSVESFKNGMAKVSKGEESFLISNPLLDGGVVLSSLSVTQEQRSDIDDNIPQTNQQQENTFAVIVANQNYSDFIVSFAINDGKTFKEYCKKTLGIPERNIIYYEDATLNNLHSVISRIKDLADVYEGDAKIIFYYTGQGLTDDNKQSYIMPSDASINLISSTCYSLKNLYKELTELNLQSAIVLLDAGFNNEDRAGNNIGKSRGVAIRNKEEKPKGKVISISATSSGETALEYKDKSHGLFTYYLCKKLQETQGKVNMEDLSNYVISKVSKTSLLNAKKKQTPKINNTELINLKKEKL